MNIYKVLELALNHVQLEIDYDYVYIYYKAHEIQFNENKIN